jgi:hypothetical protein
MRTVTLILMGAGPLAPGFHLHIENPPWMPLDIEDIQIAGPNDLPSLSVAHYGQQNGDAMRDPEMLFEMIRDGEEIRLDPYYWRNDYRGIEQYSAFTTDAGHRTSRPLLKRRHEEFALTWDANLRAQGFYEAFQRSRSR